VNFSEPLNEIVWRRVVRDAEARANACGLAARSQARTGFQVSFGPLPLGGPVGALPPMPQLDVDAIRFYRSSIDEESNRAVVAEVFTVARGALVYQTIAYTRWEAIFSQLRSMLTEPLGIALEAVYLANLRLEYKDVFKHAGDGAPIAADLFRAGSDLLAPHIYGREQLFHSHTGFFEPCDGGDQRLVQVNVDANELIENSEQIRAIAIMTAVQDNFFPNLEAERSRTSLELVSRFDSMHTRYGAVFRNLISDEIAERVGMGS
jgi:uncharacterized protein (TIGR04255 family)